MNGFLLFGKTGHIDEKSVYSYLRNTGVTEPEKRIVRSLRLLVWGKQVGNDSNGTDMLDKAGIAATGTLMYRGSSGENGLRRVLDDYARGAFDTSVLRGAFCLIMLTGERVEVITDSGNLYGIFGDRDRGVISSSLQAVLLASGRRQSIHREALCEQLVTGAITGEDTCFEGVKRLNSCGSLEVGGINVSCQQAALAQFGAPSRFASAEACIDFQLGVLREHFEALRSLAGTRGASMGLSGGYDSRLMLLLAMEARIPLKPFTFVSPNHIKEIRIAAELTRRAGLNLRNIKVRSFESLSDSELDANIEDALSYYDGRTNATMGTFGDVHTRRNQVACTGDAALNLNGIGGELYRNRERLPMYRFLFKDWLAHYVIGPHNDRLFVSRSARSHFEDYLAEKYGKLLGFEQLKWFDRELARRYYRDIWLPYSAGPRISAENQVGMALMPFAEAAVSSAAMRATPFIGTHGEFEAAMIRRVDEGIARLPSSYGPGFGIDPWKTRQRDLYLSLVPLQARLLRHRVLGRLAGHARAGDGRWRVRFAEPLRFLQSLKLPLDVAHLLRDQVSRDRTLYIAEFLHRHREHIDVMA